jgi:F-type H+-transporting ATPase subunit b
VAIDWFTLVAQVLNFVILLFLLKRFLYRPVLDAIEQREQRIRDRMDEARRKEEEAETEGRELRERRAQLEARRTELLEEAREEAETRRKELAEEILVKTDRMREDWREALRRQQETFLQELRRRIGQEAYALTARALRDLADADLEDQVIRVFLDRVRAMDEEDRADFVSALEESSVRPEVHTAFELDADRRARIVETVADWVGSDVELRFEADADLALGIEVRVGDRKVGWSVGSYLEEMEARARTFLEAETR